MQLQPYQSPYLLSTTNNFFLEQPSSFSSNLYQTPERPFSYYNLPTIKKSFKEIFFDDTPSTTIVGKVFEWAFGTHSSPGLFSKIKAKIYNIPSETKTKNLPPMEIQLTQENVKPINSELDLAFKLKLIATITITVLALATILEIILHFTCRQNQNIDEKHYKNV